MEQDDTEEMNLAVLCRLCATHSERMVGIYSDEGLGTELATKVNLHLPVKVSEADVLPLQCCEICTSTVLTWHNLVSSCVEAEQRLKDLLSEKTEKDNTYVDMEPDTEPDQPDIMEDTMEEDVEVPETINITQECSDVRAVLNQIPNVRSEEIYVYFVDTDNDDNNDESAGQIEYTDSADEDLLKRISEEQPVTSKTKQKPHQELTKTKSTKTAALQQEDNESSDEDLSKITNYIRDKRNDSILKVKLKSTSLDKYRVLSDTPGCGWFFRCDQCIFETRHVATFRAHLNDNHGKSIIATHICDICGKQYKLASELAKHLCKHSVERKHKCTVCSNSFGKRSTLVAHQKTHDEQRPFVCDVCGKGFKQNASLFVHKKFHVRDMKYQCKECEKKFLRAGDLKVHSFIHSGYKPYRCDICNSEFRLGHSYRKHMTTHNRESTLYQCDCGAKFNRLRHLAEHHKLHHNGSSICVKGDTVEVKESLEIDP